MKKFVIFIIISTGLFLGLRIKQTGSDNRIFLTSNADSIKWQIHRFENNLLPAIRVEGENKVRYSLYDRMKMYHVPGVSVALIENNRVIWAKAYGIIRSDTSDSISVSTVFQAASLSKPVTATVTMMLAEQGRLDLDKPVNSVLSQWQIPENDYTKNDAITPRMILLHTSGLNVSGFRGYEISDSIPSIIEILNGIPPANNDAVIPRFVPGSRWSYSGGGYMVLQLLLEEVTCISFPELMKKYLFEPLHMNNSTFEQPLPDDRQMNAAKGHLSNGSVVKGNWHVYPEQAAAGLWTTPYDLATFIVSLQKSVSGDSTLLMSKKTATEMLSKYIGDMGLGYLVRNEGENLAITFNGGNAGYRCDFFAYLYKGKGAVIMTNSDNGQGLINELYRSIADIYGWGDFIQEKINPSEIGKEQLASLQGDYITNWPNGEKYIFSLKADGNNLYFIHKENKNRTVAQSKDKLGVIDSGFSVDFSVNKDSRPDSAQCFLEFGNTIAVKKVN